MQPASVSGRSRFGCTTCRGRHRKCDEKRPECRACQSRGLECVYELSIKWTNVSDVRSYDGSTRRKNKATRRAAHSVTQTQQCLISHCSTQNAGRSQNPEPPVSKAQACGDVLSEDASRGACASRNFVLEGELSNPDSTPASLDALQNLENKTNGAPCLQLRGGMPDHTPAPDPEAPLGDIFQEHEVSEVPVGNVEIGELSDAGSDQSLSVKESSDSWVIDNTLSNLLFQVFQNPGEEIAFTYFFKRVCACMPAYDSGRNPYRKLALVALSYPVLLHGILSVSTGHMYNFGRSNERLLSSRQSRALKSLRTALDALQANDNPSDPTQNTSANSPGNGVFSILSSREIALAAIMMQSSSVLMTGIGDVAIHMKCALHFIQQLGYLRQPVTSVFGKMLVYRFAMVDVLLSHLRFRRPMAPLDFFLYRQNDRLEIEFDHGEPSFLEMHGCPQRVLCFLAQISIHSADLVTGARPHAQVQAEAYALETDMRVWGQKYHDAMARGTSASAVSPSSLLQSKERTDLAIVAECFYWTALILLMRRVFMDPTKSTRVQIIRRHLFCLMDKLVPGCGPDSSLPFPFYMAAREAATLEERDWVRQKHDAMMEVYRDRSREYFMASTESIWKMAATTSDSMSGDTSYQEKFIRDMDRQASYFMF